MKKTSAFGTTKPLPGQPGYKINETEVLEKEAQEMEERLRILQERMQKQNIEDAELMKNGSRWKSARTDRGSVTSYAKDVQEKHQKKKADPSLKATAAARRITRQSSSTGTFSSKTVDNWSIADVGDWLKSMMLEQHASAFAANEISGPILLDISLEDLDYMGVTVLAHRKVILKSVEDLRKNNKVTKDIASTTAHSVDTNSALKGNSKSLDTQISYSTTTGNNNKIHWSVVEPLQNNKVTNSDGDYMVNGADGGGAGMLDEEMERKLFQEAVMEWRRSAALDREGGGGKASGSVEDGEPVGGRRAGVQSKSLYEQSQLDLDEEEERKAFQEAVMQWRGSDKKAGASQAGSGMWSNPLAGDDHEAKDYSRRGMGSRGSLAVGALDEDAERKKFQAAVEAWRSGEGGGKSTADSNKEIAKKISNAMDQEHQETSMKLLQQQNDMQKRLMMVNKEYELAKRKMEAMALIDMNDDIEEDEEEAGGGGYRGGAARDHARYSNEEKGEGGGEGGGDEDELSQCSSMEGNEDGNERDPVVERYCYGEVSATFTNGDTTYMVMEPLSDEDQ